MSVSWCRLQAPPVEVALPLGEIPLVNYEIMFFRWRCSLTGGYPVHASRT